MRRLQQLLLVLVGVVCVGSLVQAFLTQTKDYLIWRADRDRLIYACGWLHRGYTAVMPGWYAPTRGTSVTTDAPRECSEFIPLIVPRSPA